MASLSDLSELIQSLAPEEIQQYRQAQKRDNALHTDLFEVLLAGEHETSEVRRKIGHSATGSAFSTLKRYLFQDLLRVLVNDQKDAGIDEKLRSRMSQAAFLRKRVLLKPTMQILRKAYAEAMKFERFSMAEEIRYALLAVIQELNDVKLMRWYLEELSMNSERVLAGIRELNQISHQYQVQTLQTKMNNISPELLARVQQPSPFKTFRASALYEISAGSVLNQAGLSDAAIRVRTSLHNRFQQQPHFIRDQMVTYLANLFNLTGRLIYTQELEQALPLLAEFRKMVNHRDFKSDPRMQEIMRFRLYSLEYSLARVRNTPEKILLLGQSESFEKCLTGLGREHLLTLRMNQIDYLAGACSWEKALSNVKQLRRSFPLNFRPEYHQWLMLAELFLLYQAGEHDFLEYQINAASRQWQLKQGPKGLEWDYIRLFPQLLQITGNKPRQEKLRSFLQHHTAEPESPHFGKILEWMAQPLTA